MAAPAAPTMAGPETVACPRCGGTGRVTLFVWHKLGPGLSVYHSVACGACAGSGRVPAGHVRDIEQRTFNERYPHMGRVRSACRQLHIRVPDAWEYVLARPLDSERGPDDG